MTITYCNTKLQFVMTSLLFNLNFFFLSNEYALYHFQLAIYIAYKQYNNKYIMCTLLFVYTRELSSKQPQM
jgi:hypothetical protein